MRDYVTDENLNLIHKLANIATKDLVMGHNCRIDAFVTITGDVTIGDNVHIGTGVSIFGSHGVTIGNGVSLSPGCKLFTGTDDPNLPLVTNPQLKERGGKYGPITIGDYSSIGAGAVILPNVTIARECQVGALSLVNDSFVADNSVIAGIPAVVVKRREHLKYGDNTE